MNKVLRQTIEGKLRDLERYVTELEQKADVARQQDAQGIMDYLCGILCYSLMK